MSNIKELIRREIERRITDNTFGAKLELIDILAWLDTLPDESEQPTRGYDEAYLDEKIAKASKSLEGVDVDKFMDEVRGRELVTDSHDLEEAKEEYLRKARSTPGHEWMTRDIEDAFRAGAEWMKTKMMEGAVEGVVWGNVGKNINISVLKGVCKYLEQDEPTYKVRMIILPKEDEG